MTIENIMNLPIISRNIRRAPDMLLTDTFVVSGRTAMLLEPSDVSLSVDKQVDGRADSAAVAHRRLGSTELHAVTGR